jgi:diaminopimelate decarboxylase
MRLVRSEGGDRSGVGQSVLEIPAATLDRIARAVGTPVYVYSADAIRARYRELTGALSDIPHRVLYSVKANSNRSILQLLGDLGAGADIVSAGELTRVLRAGYAPEDVVFSGVGKTRAELRAAVSSGVGQINVESHDELKLLDEVTGELGVVARVGVRVNPDVATDTHPYTQTGERGMKFGVPSDEVVHLAVWAEQREYLSLRGLGMHIGSQILDASRYRQGAMRLAQLVADLRMAGIGGLENVDVGGGFGIRYTTERPLDVHLFVAAVQPLVSETGLRLMLEPGRYLVGNAGYLLTRCVHRKRSGGRSFVVVDAGMNDLIRPSLYGAVHDICVVGGSAAAEPELVDVVGPICETGDFIGVDRQLPAVERGALLAVQGVGAYGFTMSSTYNSRPRPPEVVVDGARWAVVRERETIDDLMRGEPAADYATLAWQVDSGR